MKVIRLTKLKIALVDDCDYKKASQFAWQYTCPGSSSTFYARRTINKNQTQYLHHLIMGKPPFGKEIDHINGKGWDCRRRNMRVVNHSQNMLNRSRLAKKKKKLENAVS